MRKVISSVPWAKVKPVKKDKRSPGYSDTGCEFSDSCFTCPLPRCIEDEPKGKATVLRDARNKEIAALYAEGKGIKQIADAFTIDKGTVYRALKKLGQVY